MFNLQSDYDPIAPCGAELLTELGLDVGAAREAMTDDRARRCPDRETPARESWR